MPTFLNPRHLPSTLDILPSTLDILPSTLDDKNLHSDIYTGYFPGKFSDVANVYSRSVYIQNIPLNQGEMEEETTLI